MLDAIQHYYACDNANVHRGAHQLSARATESFEGARSITAGLIGASSAKEIVFTRNATEAINLVARSWGDAQLKAGDEVLLTVMEHHSNLVPWQLLAERTGCVLRHVGVTPEGTLDLADLRDQLNERTRLVSLVHISNTWGAAIRSKRLQPLPMLLGPRCWWMPVKAWRINPFRCRALALISSWALLTSCVAPLEWAFYGLRKKR